MAERTYEPNILSNPLTWFGVWTPGGWRVHRKRWGRGDRREIRLRGDGRTTFFPAALHIGAPAGATWDDDLHLDDDPFTDGGIYPADPRVEYPPGRPRWAVSHTLLCHPIADHNLYTHQYTWDLETGDLRTHFRRHAECESARTAGLDGRTVRIAGVPISRAIESNRTWDLQCSAVRGVWNNPEKTGRNYYTRRLLRRMSTANGVYIRVPGGLPVVQCRGIWREPPRDDVAGKFDPATGLAIDPAAAAAAMEIPWDCPKISLIRPRYKRVHSAAYGAEVSLSAEEFGVVGESRVREIEERVGSRFEEGRVGFARDERAGRDDKGYRGYDPAHDLDDDGAITLFDVELARSHLGRRVRLNHYLGAYFGGDWLSTGVLLAPDHFGGQAVVADYEVGGGYNAEIGEIRLLNSPGRDAPVWVEYFHDSPAAAGGEILVHAYAERG